MTLPDLYLLGAPKAGTTSLATWLGAHPDVFWSNPKEPHYWAADYPRMRIHYGFATLADYQRLFASREAQKALVRAEGSTTYLYSDVAVPSIIERVPSARFLVCLRNPVDLLVSYHRTQLVALNENEHDFGTAWRRSLSGGLPKSHPLDIKLVDYPMVGRLGAAVSRLLERVSRDRLHFIVFDDMVAAPGRTCSDVADFAGLTAIFPSSFQTRNSSTKYFRSPLLHRAMQRPPPAFEGAVARLRQWSRSTAMPGVAALKRWSWKPEPRPMVSPEQRHELASYFRNDILQLGGLIGRDLSAWCSPPQVDDG